MFLGVVQHCHNFQERPQRMLGWMGSRTVERFSKMSFMVNFAIFRRGLKNQHFQSALGRSHKKEYSLYALDNGDNSGRPVTRFTLTQPPFQKSGLTVICSVAQADICNLEKVRDEPYTDVSYTGRRGSM